MEVTLVVDSLRPPLGGIGRYTWELCQRLPEHDGIDKLHYFDGFRFIDDPARLLRGERVSRARMPRWLSRRFKRRRLRESLVHGPNYFLPPEADAGIITVHDLSVLRFPETHPPQRVKVFETGFERSLARAVHLITDTETIRREVIEQLGVSADRVTAIPLGVGSEFRPRSPDEIQPELEQLGLQPGRYGLCVSTLEPRKKISELLDAWDNLPTAIRDSPPLVLAGGEGWLNEALHRKIEGAVAEGWLKYLGFVPERSLPALYAGAALFVYPSVYEGFGLPPLEAMASGVPVIVADRSCLPEVCGGAAAYFDPDDVPTFAEAVETALTDREWRADAREKGIERAALYDWDACSAKTAALYRQHC